MNTSSVATSTGTLSGERLRVLAARLFRIGSWLYVAALAVAVGLLWLGGDEWWPATVLLFGPRWVLGIPLLLLAPLALVAGLRAARGMAAASVLFAFPLMGFQFGGADLRQEADLRVVTLNADKVKALIESMDELAVMWGADVLAVQECRRGADQPVPEVTGYELHITGGLCLLSRYSVVGVYPMERRSFAAAGGAGWSVRHDIQLPSGEVVSVFNVHLETPRAGLRGIRYGQVREGIRTLERDEVIREAEAERARWWFDGAPGPSIMLGDFNAPPESLIFRRHFGDLTNAFGAAGSGLGYTRYNGWVRARIDHVLLDEHWEALSAVVAEDVGSDHRAVIVDLRRAP